MKRHPAGPMQSTLPRRATFARGLVRPFALAATMLGLAACSTAPPPRYHSLLGSAEVAIGALPTAPRIAVLLDPVALPTTVDKPQWLVRLPDDSLALLEGERWASPLGDEYRQALLDNLIDRFGFADGRLERDGGSVPVWRVHVDVRRFESIPGREARIEGAWSLTAKRAGAPVTQCNWVVREPVADGMLALADGHRKALAELAKRIGTQIVRLQAGATTSCPAAGSDAGASMTPLASSP